MQTWVFVSNTIDLKVQRVSRAESNSFSNSSIVLITIRNFSWLKGYKKVLLQNNIVKLKIGYISLKYGMGDCDKDNKEGCPPPFRLSWYQISIRWVQRMWRWWGLYSSQVSPSANPMTQNVAKISTREVLWKIPIFHRCGPVSIL